MFGPVVAVLALVGGGLLVAASLATLAVAHHLGHRLAGPVAAAWVRWTRQAAEVGLSLGVLAACLGAALTYRYGAS